IEAKGSLFNRFQAKVSFEDWIFRIEKLYTEFFEGQFNQTLDVNLRTDPIEYKMGTTLSGLDLKKAVESEFSPFKNTLYGKLFFDLSGRGSSIEKEKIKRNLDVK